MRIGSAEIDARRSSARIDVTKPSKADEATWMQLQAYEHYQRRAFQNERRSWTTHQLTDRREALSEELMGGNPHDLHFRRLRAERDAIDDELARRAGEAP
jgi:hypothetical protein